MKTFLFTLLLFFFYSNVDAQTTANIQVSVDAIEATGEGTLVFMLFATADGFPSEAGKAKQIGRVSNYTSSATYTFSEIPAGQYAVAVFQDKNNNGQVDTNFMGMPKEPVGAYQHSRFGRPNFTKCSFTHGSSNARLQVQLMNQ